MTPLSDPIEEAAREISELSDVYVPAYSWVEFVAILQRLYDAGKKAGAAEERARLAR